MNSFIKLENVSLDYILKTGSNSMKKHFFQLIRKLLKVQLDATAFHSCYRALNNINLDIQKGDKLGILGRNGAGKSTMLRVLAEIYKPNIGKVTAQGLTSCLFDISLGLNPEATGEENIITLGILKGLTKSEAVKLIPDVAEFSELGDFLYKPVRMYSAGMGMKLAFGVATAGHPDILLIDEVIGVGDSKFQQKARARVEKLMHNSNILVITSHDNEIIKKFCNKAIVLEKGNMQYLGDVDTAISVYNQLLFDGSTTHQSKDNTEASSISSAETLDA